jgi:uncharacterized membrane protein YgcG
VGRKLASVAVLGLALFAAVGVGVAYAEEYCVNGCVVGYTCPTGPTEPPGTVELPLCTLLSPGEPEPTPTIVEVERGEATGETAAVLSARIDSRRRGVSLLVWQYSTRAEVVGGEQTLLEPLAALGSLERGEGTLGEYPVEVFRGSGSLAGLEPDTTYYFRAVVTNGSNALEYGPIASFHTDPIPSQEAPSGSPRSEIGDGGNAGSSEAPAGGSAPGSSGGGGGGTTGASSLGSAAAPSNVTNAGATGTRARKLAKALTACRSKPRRARDACVRQARKRFGEPPRRR